MVGNSITCRQTSTKLVRFAQLLADTMTTHGHYEIEVNEEQLTIVEKLPCGGELKAEKTVDQQIPWLLEPEYVTSFIRNELVWR